MIDQGTSLNECGRCRDDQRHPVAGPFPVPQATTSGQGRARGQSCDANWWPCGCGPHLSKTGTTRAALDGACVISLMSTRLPGRTSPAGFLCQLQLHPSRRRTRPSPSSSPTPCPGICYMAPTCAAPRSHIWSSQSRALWVPCPRAMRGARACATFVPQHAPRRNLSASLVLQPDKYRHTLHMGRSRTPSVLADH
jgi:hypothetical protein